MSTLATAGAGADPDMDGPVYVGIELGGTKVVCGVGRADGSVLERARIPTRDPAATLRDVHETLGGFEKRWGSPQAMGVASFGPIRIDPAAPDYGRIGPTPKVAWRGVNLVTAFAARFDGPVALQTDVIGAAIGEATWGAGIGFDPFVYITVGTGIGGGVLANGRPLTGLLHPELGHMRPPRAPGDVYRGGCANHKDCIEGLAAGPSIVARWGRQLDELGPEHEAHAVISHYIAHLVVNTVLCIAPRRIVLGGGVMSNPSLLPLVRQRARDLLGGFLAVREIEDGIDDYIVPPGLGGDSGIMGAVAMAVEAGATG